ncbi:CRISPR-associated protein, Csy1 family [Izhakiella capsodis]|uniref:CRISPR-associated protein, Csy1 family n=1 Tax=Izhakiella capsodis TaxID=1367852 RepID=A0A1I4WTV3_9GAMM|nr:type I-F CRISPR-associated protein Csy1 [Izhakiella capsodis]SFN17248.1 CRISPR-associated protein, Csy1 family [Izhakiella capsodis]
MSEVILRDFISDYIAARKQARLEVFDKSAARRLAADADLAAELQQERQELEQRYQPANWLTDAARRAGQISLVSHAAKFTHSDSKSSSVYSRHQHDEGYLASASLPNLTMDAVGNAAALDVARLLQTETDGDSLLACLQREDHRPFAFFAQDRQQLDEWVQGFSQVLNTGAPASHKLSKQIYFPVGGGYHLLNPLFSTSLAHDLYKKLSHYRFGEEAKTIRQAQRSKTWHDQPLVSFPGIAEIHFGGTKPQNISSLNSARGGRLWLLSSRPPMWKKSNKAPENLKSLFTPGERFDRAATEIITLMVNLLTRTGDYTNHRIRAAMDEYIDALTDRLFFISYELQRPEWRGWTLKSPELKRHQQLWLDPWRGKDDRPFRLAWQNDDWQEGVTADFARWLSFRLSKHLPDIGRAERQHWQSSQHFRRRLREMESIIAEGIRCVR